MKPKIQPAKPAAEMSDTETALLVDGLREEVRRKSEIESLLSEYVDVNICDKADLSPLHSWQELKNIDCGECFHCRSRAALAAARTTQEKP